MPEAARVGDVHIGPTGGGVVGGVGQPSVLVGGLPAAHVGDPAPGGGAVGKGSATVLINSKPAARAGDPSVGGGVILSGDGSVIIGDKADLSSIGVGGGAEALKSGAAAAGTGTPTKPRLSPVIARSLIKFVNQVTGSAAGLSQGERDQANQDAIDLEQALLLGNLSRADLLLVQVVKVLQKVLLPSPPTAPRSPGAPGPGAAGAGPGGAAGAAGDAGAAGGAPGTERAGAEAEASSGMPSALPDARQVVEAVAARHPLALKQSCQEQGGTWEFLDRVLFELRKTDQRWGYNLTGGNRDDPSRDAVAYHRGGGPPEGSREVFVVQIIDGRCTASPRPTWVDVTEAVSAAGRPGCWSGGGRF